MEWIIMVGTTEDEGFEGFDMLGRSAGLEQRRCCEICMEESDII